MQTSHLRPLGLGEILDGAFTLYRRHFGQFFLAAFLPQIPVILLWLAWGPLLGSVVGGDADPTGILAGMAVFFPLLIVASIFAYIFPAGALTRLAADAYLGNPVSRADAMRMTWGRLLPLLGMVLLLAVLGMLGLLLCVVPAVLAWIIFFACIPLVVLEGQNPVDALNRSQALAKGAWGEIFLTQLLFVLITLIPVGAVSLAVSVAGAVLVGPDQAAMLTLQGASNAAQAVMTALTMPLTLIGTTLLYYDRRIRVEAFGLDADLAALERA